MMTIKRVNSSEDRRAIPDDEGCADYRRFFIDDDFMPDLFTESGLRDILLNKRKRFDAFLRDHRPYEPKCSRIKGNPRDWYISPKTHDWHNNRCRECQNNLINEFRKRNRLSSRRYVLLLCLSANYP